MQTILDWGITWVLFLQQFSPALDLPMYAMTLLGEASFYIVFFPLLYWSLDRRLGVRLMLLLVLSVYINGWAKTLVMQPRPYTYDLRVIPIVTASGGGLPSGHSQNTVVIWGYVAGWLRERWMNWLFVVLLIVIPLSRVYLGVHFPTDLLGGFVLGCLLLWLFVRLEAPGHSMLTELALGWRLLLMVVAPALLMITLPPIYVRELDGAMALIGAGMGYEVARRWIRMSVGGPALQRVARFFVGTLISLGLYLGVEAMVVGLRLEGVAQAALFFPLGFWLSAGAPWFFVRVGLAEQRPQAGAP